MKYFKTDPYLIFGLALIILSTALFLIEPDTLKGNTNLFTLLFFIHYALPILYCVVLKTRFNRREYFTFFGSKIFSGHLILLVLFNLGAYSLNREMVVFYESAEWLSTLLVIENLLLILIAFLEEMPKWLKTVLFIAFPVFLLFHIHQVVLVLPLSFFGFIGSLFLGIGLLLFVPVFYIIAWVRMLFKIDYSFSHFGLTGLGLVLAAIPITYHLLAWKNMEDLIQNEYLEVDTPFYQSDLPTWITVSKNIKDNAINEAYLKSDLVYQAYEEFDFIGPDIGNYDETKIHDPLVTLCMMVYSKPTVDETSRIKILNFLYDKRHQTVDRFWSDDHLTTDQVVSNVQVFPKERLTYSELILTIANNDHRNTWQPQEEAIYTFQLPEGGVITSLSLWIAGQEEKAILTTRSKAENAYNTIVGRERRDPSVIYWMEGNKARIRVFPCTPDEKRKFKVGVTAPLRLEEETLVYQPVVFKGPDFNNARASINIVAQDTAISSDLTFTKNQDFISWKGDYQPYWTFSLKVKPAPQLSFSFMNETFASKETVPTLKSLDPKNIYLDLNNHWTDDELRQVKTIFADKNLIVLDGPKEIKSSAGYPNFTLFPYHKVSSPKESIVLTKGDIQTPNLEDLKNSEFRKSLFAQLNEVCTPVLVLDLAETPSNYNQSLKEFGVISYHKIELADLKQFSAEKRFPDPTPDASVVKIAGNGISIEKLNGSETLSPGGSDHLMRLFYYQSIMDQIGKTYFSSEDDAYIEADVTALASIGHVVTPLSSLIVLESQQDYDRFDIERNKDSLGNASLNNLGAVPEPHEWALIIAGLSLIILLYFKNGLNIF